MGKQVTKIANTIKDLLNTTALKIMPGQLAFNFTLIIIAVLSMFVYVVGLFTKNFDALSYLSNILPSGIDDLLKTLVVDNPSTSMIVFLVSVTLLTSRGFTSVIHTSNILYGIKDTSYLKIKARSILLFFIIIFLMAFIVVIPLLGHYIVDIILNFFRVNTSVNSIDFLYKILELPLSFLIVFIFIDSIFILAPSAKIPAKTTKSGSLFVSFGWIVITNIFSIYITNFAHYNEIYSNVANIVMLLVWIYFLAYIFVIGLVINYRDYQNYKSLSNK